MTQAPHGQAGTPGDLQAAAQTLMLDGLSWLEGSYDQHRFFVERDLVWTLQRWLLRESDARGLPLRILNDYGVEAGPRRSLSADLAILGDSNVPLLAAEFKFEPSHLRNDIDRRKFPVTDWNGICHDIERIRRWVHEGLVDESFAVLIDEGGSVRRRRHAETDCDWVDWGPHGTDGLAVSIHTFHLRGPARVRNEKTQKSPVTTPDN